MLTRDDLVALDGDDPLAAHRDRFHLPEGVLYLDGNSLGAQPVGVAAAAEAVLDEWRERLIGGWFDAGWWELPAAAGGRIARIIGVDPALVIVCDTVTTNLFKTLGALLGLRQSRAVVLVQETAFPTDRYVVESVAAATGRTVRVVPRGARLEDHLDDAVAVAVLEHLDFRTGGLLDLPATTAAVHEVGGLALWDLSHTAGVMPLDLDAAGVDAAVGCTYKYLNGGPGAPAYVFVAAGHLPGLDQPIQGWLGHADPFVMADEYTAAPGIRRFLTGTQPIVSMRALDAALTAYDDVDLGMVRDKSVGLTDACIRLVDERCAGRGVEVITPRQAARRGSQVSLRLADAEAVQRRLADAGVIGDFRTPDILRFGFAPLYVSHADVWDSVDILQRSLAS